MVQRKDGFLCPWDYCGKQLSTKWSLRRHLFVHEPSEKPEICDYLACGKAFVDQTLLARHKLCHTQGKSNNCHFIGCTKAFKDKVLLRHHLRLHFNPATFACSEGSCTKLFCSPSSLLIHRKICHGVPGSDTTIQLILRTVFAFEYYIVMPSSILKALSLLAEFEGCTWESAKSA